MARRPSRLPHITRGNRLGCFAIALIVAMLVAALIYIGSRENPRIGDNTVIPTPG